MRKITECFEDRKTIAELIEQEQVDEGLRDFFALVKRKFKGAVKYLKGIVAKFGSYFVPIDKTGNIMPCVSPLTAGQAYKDGEINKSSTFIHMDGEGARITGCKNDPKDALKLPTYAKYEGNSLKYYADCDRLGESVQCTLDDLLESEDLDERCKEYIREGLENEDYNDFVNEVKLASEDPQACYNKIVDNKELMDEIAMAIKKSEKGMTSGRLLIFGAPGIGKSAIIRKLLEDKRYIGYRLIVKTLSNETPDNFTLPTYVYKEDETVDELETSLVDNGSGNGRYSTKEKGTPIAATDVPKTWMPVYKPTGDPARDVEMNQKLGHGILFIDELSRATPQVLNVCLPLVNEGDFNGYKLGTGWTIIVASNRDEDETSGQSNIGAALASRFGIVYYEPTVYTWREWADTQGFMSPLLLNWLSMPKDNDNIGGGNYYYWDPNDEGSIEMSKLMCNPRQWTNAMQELALYSDTGKLEGFSIFDLPDSRIQRVLNKFVPKDAVDNFMGFLKVVQGLGVNFDDAVYDVWQNAGKSLKLDKKSVNKIMLPIGQLICSAHNENLPTEKEWDNLCTWIVDQNSNQLASYILGIAQTTFGGMITTATDASGRQVENKTLIEGLFWLQTRMNKIKSSPTTLGFYNTAYKKFLDHWGLSSVEDIPDYSTGMMKLVKKYGEQFALKINGKDALG